MTAKRQASYTIDPHTLEENDKHSDHPLTNLSSTEEKAERKIFKIKRPEPSSSNNQSKVSFTLNQSQEIKPSGQSTDPKDQEILPNPFANLFKADKNIFNGIGIFTNSSSMNLFTSNKGTEQTAKNTANQSAGINIFSANTSETSTGKNIFANPNSSLKGTSASLFKTNGASLFQQNTTSNTPAPTQNNYDDDGSGDSAQLEEAQKIQSDPSKSTKSFNYDDSCPVLLTIKASKFKKASSDLIENVEVVLQKQKSSSIKYISVRLPVTKKNIFSGILVDKRSEVKNINSKKQNVEVGAFIKEKEGFVKVPLKFQVIFLFMQFEKEEDGQKLFERLQELLSGKEPVESQQNKDKKE